MKILIIILLLASTAYAYEKPIAAPLFYYVQSLGKSEGADIQTAYKNGQYVITYWNVKGVDQPKPEEMATIIDNYEKRPIPKTIEERLTEAETKLSILEHK